MRTLPVFIVVPSSFMALDHEDLNAAEEFDSVAFANVDMAAVKFAGKSFYGCEFTGLSALEADLGTCVFEDCLFLQCDLTMASLRGASLRGVVFRNCKLMGIDWSPASGLTFAVTFEMCVLSHGVFTDLRMKNTQFTHCKAHEASFAGVDLRGANFAGTDLHGARFLDTNLEEADFSTAENYVIRPEDNRLKNTKFSVEAALALVSTLGIIV